MKFTVLTFSFIFAVLISTAQITRGYWMFGGNLNSSTYRVKTDNQASRTTNLDLSSNAGYFLLDKLVGGLVLSYSWQHIKYVAGLSEGNFSTIGTFYGGPFIRYYFLSVENRYNLILDLNYQFGNFKNKNNINSIHSVNMNKAIFSAGPVLFFNKTDAIEFLLNYSYTKPDNEAGSPTKSFGVGIGFQIHLTNYKN